MNNAWMQELMRFFLQGMTLKQLIHMLIILIFLIVVMPVSAKEWVNAHNPEILPNYWMYYILLFCLSYVANNVINYCCQTYSAFKSRKKEQDYERERERESAARAAEIKSKFDSLSISEQCLLAFAVSANNRLVSSLGDEHVKSLIQKGLLFRSGPSMSGRQKDVFNIPKQHFHECYMRFAGKAESLADEVIALDKRD